MVLLFFASAAVQYNDPDPLPWAALYLACAVVSAWSAAGRASWVPAAAVGLVAGVWALTIAPRVLGAPGFPTFEFGEGMKSEVVEETRELFGLLIGAGWMASVGVRAAARRHR